MKQTFFVKKGEVAIKETEKPAIEQSTDAIIRIVRASVCGSDLWWFRGISPRVAGPAGGHEAIGVIEEVGSDVKNFKVGDFVVIPFTDACGHCRNCLAGFEASCVNAGHASHSGYQIEFLRKINADGSLVKIPGQPSDYTEDQLASLTTLADVMPTGYHSAWAAEIKPGDTVVVFGDGAVGLCAVIGAKLMGAGRIIAMSRHEDRAALAREFGATDIVPERGAAAVDKILEMTDGFGADAVLECVGMKEAVETAFQVAAPGAKVSRVGVPHDVDYNPYMNKLFYQNIALTGGIASVTKHDRELLLEKVLDGSINPGRVFTASFTLDEIQAAYDAMDQRKAIKSLLTVSD